MNKSLDPFSTPLNAMSSDWPEYSLGLADGSRWNITGKDELAAQVVARLASVMQLSPQSGEVEHRIEVAFSQVLRAKRFLDNEICFLYHGLSLESALPGYFIKISLFLVHQLGNNGAILLHGALAQHNGQGVILAARSGTGKTTASLRLPEPWRSQSDDLTLVVRDQAGGYHAHPWPTWSQFRNGGKGGQWDVAQSVPLKAIFFLQQAIEDRVEPISPGQAVGRLIEASEQAVGPYTFRQNPERARSIRLTLFETACNLSRQVPSYYLHLSLNGAFWEHMERILR